jgi:acetolactate synthase I/II/III large subunit
VRHLKLTKPVGEQPVGRSGGALLVECLRAHEVPLWTCVPGESFLPILDALYELRDEPDIRLITTRHEAAAANAAEAAGKLTGRPAVCLVTRGPGAAHASIGLHTAYQDGTPMILVVGQVARAHLGRQAFQEMDYTQVFGCSAKSVVTIMDADRIPEHVARAVHLSRSGRPGPVVLVTPEDVLSDLSSVVVQVAPAIRRPIITARDSDLLHDELRRAHRPILIVGGPGWSQVVGEQVQRFAERNHVPIAAAFRWQDSVDNASPAYAGYLGLGCSPRLRQRIAESDLVLAFGPRLDDPTTDGYTLTETARRVVVLSEAEDELCLGPVPDAAVYCELASGAAVLDSLVLPDNPDRAHWSHTLRLEQQNFSTPPGRGSVLDGGVDLGAVVQHTRASLPDDAVITNGAGNYTVWLQRFFAFRQVGTQLAPRNGAMGYGLPAGLAAAALCPGRKIVTFAGDGCLLMSGSELATAAKYRLRVIVVVANNAMFGTIRMHQEREYPGRVIATDLLNPDFAAYAESFGVLGLRVAKTGDFPAAFAEALHHDGPALIELRTDPAQITPDRRLLATPAESGEQS